MEGADTTDLESVLSLGQQLQSAREKRGMSVADVSRQLRMSVRQVEALEAGDFDKLPAGTFLRGFIRNYAKLVLIEAEPLLHGLTLTQQSQVAAQKREVLPKAENMKE